uniref:baseplate multidomain protein megatron n=1 Tax=Actibacterium sp. TaxID=1872125 RepID=UPI00356B3E90
MATIVLSAVGAAVGSAVGGSVLGLSSVVIGRAVGATLGQVIDQTLMGSGSAAVETGKVDRFRLTGASEGAAVNRLYGRNRMSGQVIWASRFLESTDSSGGGKTSGPEVISYSYSVSLAIAICEGQILRLGRVWADGVEMAKDDLNLRLYHGTEDQLPDPKMEAVEGVGLVPAYRGIAYVVIEDLPLAPHGNRVPQFSFEVVRAVPTDDIDQKALSDIVPGVALIPGTGEYALAMTPVYYGENPGESAAANINTPSGKTDFATSLEVLNDEMTACNAALLVSCWFGDDLRAGHCRLQPKVNQNSVFAEPMEWMVSGLTRAEALEVPVQDDRPVYGGTPADHAVVEAITALKAAGKAVTFYPFILMDQVAGNDLPDPYSDAVGQANLPWRGRITTDYAPGVPGSTDRTAAAEAEVAAFFGAAQPGDFQVDLDPAYAGLTEVPPGLPLPPALLGGNSTVSYSGPAEWSYRRFILHYAHLCAAVGGVGAFCIGSEMRGLTRIRGAGDTFPAVEALKALAADVRTILGPEVKIGYAADWSEYFGYQPQDGSGDVYFHLDALWSDPNIDFIGIDNYMPMSDWRDGDDHADVAWETIYDLDYLRANIEGGEGYDWYYANQAAADAQRRTPISDGAYGEDWVFRYKDIRNWWLNPHYQRIAGVRQASPTDWVPQSKPVWFTEFGCAAIDKGTNQPNKFLDPKSSESALPAYSSGLRDDLLQQQYLRAMIGYWSDPARNPVSVEYDGPMIDMARAHVWAWDARPYPHFPANTELWGDGANYARGHWLNGRASAQSLAAVVAEICAQSGVDGVEASRLYGLVRGYAINDIQGARSSLQPLMLAYGFDAVERDGQLRFQSRGNRVDGAISVGELAVTGETEGDFEMIRAPRAETAGRVRLNFVESEGDYETRSAEAIFPDEATLGISVSDVPLVLTQTEGRGIAERWLAEARVARDRARFALPPSRMDLGAGDVAELQTAVGRSLFRIDRVEQGAAQLIEAVRVEPSVYAPSDAVEEAVSLAPFVPPVPVFPLFLDLPLLTGAEVEHAPHLAVTATPWPGSAALFSAISDAGYSLNTVLSQSAAIGVTQTPLFRATASEWDRGPALRVRMSGGGGLASADVNAVLSGAN